jgi:hypothetical protein
MPVRALALLLPLLLAACTTSTTKETWRPAVGPETEIEVPPIRPARVWDRSSPPATTGSTPAPAPGAELEERCEHVWVQSTWHTYEQVIDGLPSQAICLVTVCPKCGEIRHECRRAEGDPRRRSPRSRTR